MGWRKSALLALSLSVPVNVTPPPGSVPAADWRIAEAVLKDKIKGGWVGQMVGCAWGGPTEFRFNNVLMQEKDFPVWEPQKINEVFSNLGDDVYVELPFLDAIREQGVNADWHTMGDAFRDSSFDLWHANANGRNNLRQGLKVPASGHYRHNRNEATIQWSEHDDIDFQIEADFAGIVAPGLPNAAIDLAWRAGHSMNWGNGVYGGVMVAVMHSAAYTAESVDEIIDAGRQAIPVGTRFREMMDNVIDWKKQGRTYEENWRLATDAYKRTGVSGVGDPRDDLQASDCDYIDVTQNGAYILLGLLYGGGDFERSMKLAMQAGGDSDCNPSSVAGILGSFMGYEAIPERWKSGLDYKQVFPHTDYTIDHCIDLSYDLAKEVVAMSGGRISATESAGEVFVIPRSTIVPAVFEQCGYRKNKEGLVDSRLPIDNSPPELKAEITKQKGNTVTFSARAEDNDGIKEYCWFYGDLSYEKAQNPTHIYQKAGLYKVVCYVSDGKGYTSFQEFDVKVEEK